MYPSDKLPIKVKHYDYSSKHIINSVENSLINLKTDYLDCLLLHRPSPLMDVSEISETINKLIRKEKLRVLVYQILMLLKLICLRTK